MKPYQIRKPTHAIFDAKGTPAIGLLQVRSQGLACLNRFENGKLKDKVILYSLQIESLLSGNPGELQFVWHFQFGETGQKPERIESK